MRIQYKKNKEKGNVLLLCIVAVAILITLSNLITAVVVGRSFFTKKVADLNDFTLLLEDANIEIQNEFLNLQAQDAELVQYYFTNAFYDQMLVGGFAGSSSFHNTYLKRCINTDFQKMIKLYYEEYVKPLEREPDKDIDAAQDEMNQMAVFLYMYLTAFRMSDSHPQVPSQYGMSFNLQKKIEEIKLDLKDKGKFSVVSQTNGVRRGLFEYRGSYGDIDESTLQEYLDKCWSEGPLLPISEYKLVTELQIDASYRLGISKVEQIVNYRLLSETFDVVHNGFAYDATLSPSGNKLEVNTWITRGIR